MFLPQTFWIIVFLILANFLYFSEYLRLVHFVWRVRLNYKYLLWNKISELYELNFVENKIVSTFFKKLNSLLINFGMALSYLFVYWLFILYKTSNFVATVFELITSKLKLQKFKFNLK